MDIASTLSMIGVTAVVDALTILICWVLVNGAEVTWQGSRG